MNTYLIFQWQLNLSPNSHHFLVINSIFLKKYSTCTRDQHVINGRVHDATYWPHELWVHWPCVPNAAYDYILLKQQGNWAGNVAPHTACQCRPSPFNHHHPCCPLTRVTANPSCGRPSPPRAAAPYLVTAALRTSRHHGPPPTPPWFTPASSTAQPTPPRSIPVSGSTITVHRHRILSLKFGDSLMIIYHSILSYKIISDN